MAAVAPVDPAPSATKRALAKLNDYKEVLAIVIFFLGGVWWIQDRYPTKSDLKSQLTSVNCLLNKYMQLTQRQLQHEQLIAQVTQLDQQLGSAPSAPLSPSLQQTFSDLQARRASLRTKSDSASDEMQKINDELARNVCAAAL